MNQSFYKVVFALVGLGLALSAEAQFGPTPVNVAPAEMKVLAPSISVSASVVSPNDSQVAARVDGQLTYVANVGDFVKAGGRLARIEDLALKLRYDEQQARLASAQRQLVFLSSEVDRLTALARQNLSSQTELDSTSSERDRAKASVDELQAQLAQIELNRAYLNIEAPFDGVVLERLAQVGELVAPGTPVVRLVENVNLEVSAAIPLTAYRFAEPGSSLAFTSPLGNGSAVIRAVANVADSRSRLMELRASLADEQWPVGLDVKLQIPIGPSETVLAVPRDALVLRREGARVFKVNADNKAEQISVVTGLASGEWIQISGNIQANDNIVIRGAERLQPGQDVVIKDNNAELISL